MFSTNITCFDGCNEASSQKLPFRLSVDVHVVGGGVGDVGVGVSVGVGVGGGVTQIKTIIVAKIVVDVCFFRCRCCC